MRGGNSGQSACQSGTPLLRAAASAQATEAARTALPPSRERVEVPSRARRAASNLPDRDIAAREFRTISVSNRRHRLGDALARIALAPVSAFVRLVGSGRCTRGDKGLASAPLSSRTVQATVGVPRESRASQAKTRSIRPIATSRLRGCGGSARPTARRPCAPESVEELGRRLAVRSGEHETTRVRRHSSVVARETLRRRQQHSHGGTRRSAARISRPDRRPLDCREHSERKEETEIEDGLP